MDPPSWANIVHGLCDHSLMDITSPCVVTLTWVLSDAQGQLIDELSEPVELVALFCDMRGLRRRSRCDEGARPWESRRRLGIGLNSELIHRGWQRTLWAGNERSRETAGLARLGEIACFDRVRCSHRRDACATGGRGAGVPRRPWRARAC